MQHGDRILQLQYEEKRESEKTKLGQRGMSAVVHAVSAAPKECSVPGPISIN